MSVEDFRKDFWVVEKGPFCFVTFVNRTSLIVLDFYLPYF